MGVAGEVKACAVALTAVTLSLLASFASSNSEGDALYAFRRSLSDPENVLQSWDPTLVNPCTWFHITCNQDNRVTRLDLGNSNLLGHLVPDIGKLEHLQYLELYKNDIQGTIPAEIGNLKSLISLDLYNNNISGFIPPALGKLKSLVFLRLNDNKLTGRIPRELAGVSSLKVVDVSNNNLCGTIPTTGSFEHIPLNNAAEGNNMQASRVSAFGAFDQSTGFGVNDGADLSRKHLLNTKSSGNFISSDSIQFGAYGKAHASTDVTPVNRVGHVNFPQQKGQPTNLAPSSIGQFENWGESNMADNSPRSDSSTDEDMDDGNQRFDKGQAATVAASDSSERSKEKVGDQKTLRRLAQNREAARKSRLRKKAYVQQLENSRLKLTQLEQELQRARQQGIFISSTGDQVHSTAGNGALAFDVEYARWLEEQNRLVNELRAAVNAHASDNDLRAVVDGIMAHYDEIFRLKGNAAKADVFHMLSGMWKTPAERCFLWLGGFRSSELLKLLVNHLEPLTEQQLMGICNLQQSSQQAEDALSQGMEALQQSLAETLAGAPGPSGSSGNVANYMGQMAMAMGKLGTLENFLRQADNLRQQTLQQMHRILTTRQSARALLAISDYFSRLRALSSLWLARPRE